MAGYMENLSKTRNALRKNMEKIKALIQPHGGLRNQIMGLIVIGTNGPKKKGNIA